SKKIWLCIFGVLLILLLERFRIIGAILLAMLVITLLGVALGMVHVTHLVAMPPSIAPTFLQLSLPPLLDLQSWIVILIFLFVALFDNTGTLITVLHEAKMLPK